MFPNTISAMCPSLLDTKLLSNFAHARRCLVGYRASAVSRPQFLQEP